MDNLINVNSMRLLKQLSETFGPSTAEEGIIEIISGVLKPNYQTIVTPHKNLIVYKDHPNPKKTIVFQSHMDELGFRPYRYLADGFIQLTPMGGVPSSVSNQCIVFWPSGVRGVLVVRSDSKPATFFADVGAKDAEEAMNMVPYHSNGAYGGVIMEESPTQLMGKSFDDRAGCAAITIALKELEDSLENRVIGVFTAREETGNWPVTELYRAIHEKDMLPDLIVNVECCPGGPTPGDPDPLAELRKGIALVNMDASYEPDAEICLFMQQLAIKHKILNQHMAVRDGSGELGRLALGFGVAGYPLTIPVRYMHSPHSVMAKRDFAACVEMILNISRYY